MFAKYILVHSVKKNGVDLFVVFLLAHRDQYVIPFPVLVEFGQEVGDSCPSEVYLGGIYFAVQFVVAVIEFYDGSGFRVRPLMLVRVGPAKKDGAKTADRFQPPPGDTGGKTYGI